MPTATDPRRRAGLRALAALGWGSLLLGGPVRAAPAPHRASGRPVDLMAAWVDTVGTPFAGVLRLLDDRVEVRRSQPLPTRAHGLLRVTDGDWLVLARRPGPWLLRWSPDREARAAEWLWLGDDRRGCGHGVCLPDGRVVTTEMDREHDRGLIVVRDPRTLSARSEWPTGGIDPHELLVLPEGDLLVANGGVPQVPEAGRRKGDVRTMDSSLVRLSATDGRVRGTWRLADRRLSLRHLARHADGTVGVALQAEHDDPAARDAAPVLALWRDDTLRTADAVPGLQGYGGSVVATDGGFAVSAPRGGTLLHFGVDGRLRARQALAEVCALAVTGGTLRAGGRQVLSGPPDAERRAPLALTLDNHWAAA